MQAAQPEPLAAEPGSWLALGISKSHLGLTAWGRALLPALCPKTPGSEATSTRELSREGQGPATGYRDGNNPLKSS